MDERERATVRALLAGIDASETSADLRVEIENLRHDLTRAGEAQGELLADLAKEEAAHGRTIDQRDEAEEALSQAYYLIVGRAADWSSAFGKDEALEDIDAAQIVLRHAISTTQAELAEARENLARVQAHLSSKAMEFNALRARVVEVGKPVVDCWGVGKLNINAMTDFVLALSNLVKEVES